MLPFHILYQSCAGINVHQSNKVFGSLVLLIKNRESDLNKGAAFQVCSLGNVNIHRRI